MFLVFWTTGMVVIVVHELGHAFTCKYFGGQVHEMGAMLIYFQPAKYLHVNACPDRKSTRLNSSHSQISYAVFCLKKKKPDPTPPALHDRPPHNRIRPSPQAPFSTASRGTRATIYRVGRQSHHDGVRAPLHNHTLI